MTMKHVARSRWIATSTAISLFGMATAVAMAAEPQKPVADKAAESVADSSGLRAYIDPVTGQLREATPDELAAEARVSASTAGGDGKAGGSLVVVRRADGTMRAHDTEGRFMESVVATRSADGKITLSFVQGNGTSSHVEPAPVVAEEK